MDIITPQKLWDGYDRTTEPSPNIIIEKPGDFRLYFNGHSQAGCTVRVYARLVLPNAGSPAPVNSAAHGGQSAQGGQAQGGQPSSEDGAKKPPVIILVGSAKSDIDNENVAFFGAQGFAVLLVDYFGKREGKTHFTVYPKTIDAFWEQDHSAVLIPPKELKKSCWYYWTTCLLHAVTFLEKCPHVDKDKIGIAGIDEGAALVFKTSFCKAIKAGVTYFGGDLTGITFLEGLSGSGTGSGAGFGNSLLGKGSQAGAENAGAGNNSAVGSTSAAGANPSGSNAAGASFGAVGSPVSNASNSSGFGGAANSGGAGSGGAVSFGAGGGAGGTGSTAGGAGGFGAGVGDDERG